MMNGGNYIETSINNVRRYLQFSEFLNEQKETVEKQLIETDNSFKELKENIRAILVVDDLLEIKENQLVGNFYGTVGNYTNGIALSILNGKLFYDLCNIFQVEVGNELKVVFGNHLHEQACTGASDKKSIRTCKVRNSYENSGGFDYTVIESKLNQVAKNLKDQVHLKFGAPEITNESVIINIVTEFPIFKQKVKKVCASKFKDDSNKGFEEQIKEPEISLFDLLEDKDLKTHIEGYKKKSLTERQQDPLREVFRLNANLKVRNIANMNYIAVKNLFFNFFPKSMRKRDKNDIFFVMLELLGKDYVCGNGTTEFPECKLYGAINVGEVRNWYKENMLNTDLFDDLKMDKSNDIYNKVMGNFNREEIKNVCEVRERDKENMLDTDLFKDSSNNICNEKEIKEEKYSTLLTVPATEENKLAYKIGLILDISATILFVYLGTTNPLFFIALVVTIPFGIFFGIKSFQGCLNLNFKRLNHDVNSDLNRKQKDFLKIKDSDKEIGGNKNTLVNVEIKMKSSL